ncbi:hypothetical protein [Pseudanabaena sp. FACHB-2040]|uniref:hypothetical protein n=1 Tax=Pseudanabaena sp. FACHB-2040 TaxID=2692859 RepID=UPI0016894628|nr:hypothetical protein [Pseudanabaena sp. FACHB-2040]MBD2256477.1 hypothetical protein [Pseudanabaena sp. FACHB-2040]
MFLSVDTLPQDRQQRNCEIKKVGLHYWQQLYQAGIPKDDARKIAAAIAKFDVAQRPPAPDQAQLIECYSPLICRARLWRRDLLQWQAQAQISKRGF